MAYSVDNKLILSRLRGFGRQQISQENEACSSLVHFLSSDSQPSLTQGQRHCRRSREEEHGAPLRGGQHDVDGQRPQDAGDDKQLVDGAKHTAQRCRGNLWPLMHQAQEGSRKQDCVPMPSLRVPTTLGSPAGRKLPKAVVPSTYSVHTNLADVSRNES